jgi:LSD1 subclass zinc finger protein
MGAGDVATCGFCHAQVPVPENYRALRAAEQQGSADRAAAEALFRTLGKPPSAALRGWAKAAELAGGAVFAVIALILWINATLILLAGLGLELVMHLLARPIGIDFIDRFGAGPAYGGFAVCVIVFGLFPNWLVGYLDTSAEIRRTLQANLAARPPERPGFPSTCRQCGAALDVPPGALGVRCTYCESDNLVALPAEWVAAANARQEHFHRSIVDADSRARALRAEARAGLPKAAKACAIAVLVFGGVGSCSVWFDRERTLPSFGHSMGPPRKLCSLIDDANQIPIDTLTTEMNLTDYIVALHDGEVFEVSTPDGGWPASVSVKNTTTFPGVAWSRDVAWGPQTDGTYAAHFVAPYTGLFEISISGPSREDQPVHKIWRVGVHSKPGLPPPPPITSTPATGEVRAPAPLAREAQAIADRIHARLVASPAGRPDLLVTLSDGNAKRPAEVIDLWSVKTGERLRDPELDTGAAGMVISSDGQRLVMPRPDHLAIWVISEDGTQLILAGIVLDLDPITATTFLGPRVFATGDAYGVIHVWSADTGMELYRIPDKLPAAVTALAISADGKTLTAGYAGGARAFTVATPTAWGR